MADTGEQRTTSETPRALRGPDIMALVSRGTASSAMGFNQTCPAGADQVRRGTSPGQTKVNELSKQSCEVTDMFDMSKFAC